MRINEMWEGNKIRKFAVKLQIKLNCSEQEEKKIFFYVCITTLQPEELCAANCGVIKWINCKELFFFMNVASVKF